MNRQTKDLLDRTLRFSIDAIRFSESFPHNPGGSTLARQLIRSVSSVGANLREAHRSRSRAEFVSKIQICLQEAGESEYWLQVALGANIGDQHRAKLLVNEAEQLVAIFAAITKTVKFGSPKNSDPAKS